MPNPATSWLDIMPVIDHRLMPDGVVLVSTDDERHAITATPYAREHADCFAMILDGPSQGQWIDKCWAGGWRVDLDDPQGFAYAARYHYQQISHPNIAVVPMPPAQREAQLRVLAWLVGYVTDADRLALATALAEVSR